MSHGLLLIYIEELFYRYDKLSILLQSYQTHTRVKLLVRIAFNLMCRRSYWAHGPGNICDIVTIP
jgi:hypothetical protein